MDTRTHYELHDEVYKDRRGRDEFAGWDDNAGVEFVERVVREVNLESEVTAAGFDVVRSEIFVDGDDTDELVLVARKPE